MAEIPTKFAWVIEGDGVYWDGHHADARGFTNDPNKAIRFARKEDADIVKFRLLEAYAFALKTTEHGWINAWCESCQSYHPVPRDAAHKTALGCEGVYYFADSIQEKDRDRQL